MLRGYGMCRGILILLILCHLGRISTSSPGYSGFLGCLFDPKVCNADEECVDDNLFGNCQSPYSRDSYRYDLDQPQLETLEDEIQYLVGERYSWTSVLTQCKLGNILLSYRTKTPYDPDFCTGSRDLGTGELTKDSLNILQKYFADYYDTDYSNDEGNNLDTVDPDDVLMRSLMTSSSSLLPQQRDVDYMDPRSGTNDVNDYYPDVDNNVMGPIEKKDEFVNIHKYLKSHKRDPKYTEAEKDAEAVMYYKDLLENLTPEDVDTLIDILKDEIPEETREEEEVRPDYDYPQYGSVDDYYDEIQRKIDDYQGNDEENNDQTESNDVVPITAPSLSNEDVIAPDAENMQILEEKSPLPEFMQMTEDDAKLIGDLLQERLRVTDLQPDQVERLTNYVDSMLKTLSEMRESGGEDIVSDDVVSSEDAVAQEPDDQQVIEMILPQAADDQLEEAVKKEQNNFDVLMNPAENSRWQVMVEQKKSPPDPAYSSDLTKDPHDNSFDDSMAPVPSSQPKYDLLDTNFAYLQVTPQSISLPDAQGLVTDLESLIGLPPQTLTDVSVLDDGEVDFRVTDNDLNLNATSVAALAMSHSEILKNRTGYRVIVAGIGHDQAKIGLDEVSNEGPKYFVLTFILCGCIAGLVLAGIALYVLRRHSRSKEKLAQIATTSGNNDGEASKDYQDLCRQRMQSKSSEKPEPLHVAARVGSTGEQSVRSPSSRSSTSSWSEEPVQSNMDISTGHVVLSYMEDHMKNKDRLEEEWLALCNYEAEPNATTVASDSNNMRKNRYNDVLPYDHSRVVLSSTTNVASSDYINASTITDHDPRNPAYIATQGPLPHTVADFWQMVWEQGSVVLVNLTKLTENGVAMCHRYWPEEGSDLYHIYEVHLVSEHIWCPEYLVRSFYLKNLQTNETRTVTQFHFLAWPDLGIPDAGSQGLKALLDFRRKVNKSYRGRSCPIVVHCNDGSGRTGAYCLIDMVLNRMSKGAKEIDIAATLEHIRDQRMLMVKTKQQFEFCLASVAEEVHAILKALPQ